MQLTQVQLDEAARELRNRYYRDWRAANRDKVRQYNRNYYKHKLEKMAGEKIEIIEITE